MVRPEAVEGRRDRRPRCPQFREATELEIHKAPRRRHPVPPIPLPRPVRTPRVGPGARHEALAASQHPPAAPAPARGGGARPARDPPGGSSVGRPQTLYVALETADRENRDFRLLAEILAGLATGAEVTSRAADLARTGGGTSRSRAVRSPGPGRRRATTWPCCKRRCPPRASTPGSAGRTGARSRSRCATAPVPRAPRGPPRARVRRPPRPGRGDARGAVPAARAEGLRAPDRARDLPLLGPQRLNVGLLAQGGARLVR